MSDNFNVTVTDSQVDFQVVKNIRAGGRKTARNMLEAQEISKLRRIKIREMDKKIEILNELAKASKDILSNYEKCNQNPHNDPTVSYKLLDKLRDAVLKFDAEDI